jgi:hypothetical protein
MARPKAQGLGLRVRLRESVSVAGTRHAVSIGKWQAANTKINQLFLFLAKSRFSSKVKTICSV